MRMLRIAGIVGVSFLLLTCSLLSLSAFATEVGTVPVIEYQGDITEVETEKPLFIRIPVRGAERAAVYFKDPQEQNWSRLTMQAEAGGTFFTTTIPAGSLSEGEFQYYFEAEDGSGNLSTTKTHTVRVARRALRLEDINVPQQTPAGWPLLVSVAVRGASEVDLLVRTEGKGDFHRIGMAYNPETMWWDGIVPSDFTNGNTVEYLVEAKELNTSSIVRSGRRTIPIIRLAPTIDEGDISTTEIGVIDETYETSDSGTSDSGIAAISGAFWDLKYFNYNVEDLKNGSIQTLYVGNIHNQLNPISPGSLVINSKNNQPRYVQNGTNPHRGLDFNITSQDLTGVVAVTDGKLLNYGKKCGEWDAYGNCLWRYGYTKVGLELDGDNDYNDTFLFYLGFDETSTTWRKTIGPISKGTPLGRIDPGYNHLHISWRPNDTDTQDMPQQRFWSNLSEMFYGMDAEFISDPIQVDRLFVAYVYAINTGGSEEVNQSPKLVYTRSDTGQTLTVSMQQSIYNPRYYYYQFPSGGFYITYYIFSKRTGYETYGKAYRPVQYCCKVPDLRYSAYVP